MEKKVLYISRKRAVTEIGPLGNTGIFPNSVQNANVGNPESEQVSEEFSLERT